jgi:hypothetical protein
MITPETSFLLSVLCSHRSHGTLSGTFWLSGQRAHESLALLGVLPWDEQDHRHRPQ